jgi:HupE / UreJ protein
MNAASSPNRRHRSLVCWTTCFALLVVAGQRAGAHELGTTRVDVSFPSDRAYAVAITTDASALLARLEVARHEPRSNPDSAEAYQQRFDRFCEDVRPHVTLTFNGVPAVFRASCVVDGLDAAAGDPSALGVTVTLTGIVPDGVDSLRWRYDLTAAAYTLATPGRGGAVTLLLEGGEESPDLAVTRGPAPPSRGQALRTDFVLGFTQILPRGLEQVLFLVGVFFVSRRRRAPLWMVAAFIVPHATVLAVASADVVSVPPALVEPLVALSIAYISLENLMTSELKAWRVALIVGCGLLHAVDAAGVPDRALLHAMSPAGLAAFNLGVEAGQLSVVGLALAVTGRHTPRSESFNRLFVVPAASLTALAGLIWTIESVVTQLTAV